MQLNLWGEEPQGTTKNAAPSLEDQQVSGGVMNAMESRSTAPSPLTEEDVEKVRLLLSVYQDGSGMLALNNGLSRPGWRDFERAVAAALGGKPPKGEGREGKNVFDVAIPLATGYNKGISCKMRRELNRIISGDHRVSIELSNSAQQFWDYLSTKGIDHKNYREHPTEVGIALIELVVSWHQAESIVNGGTVNLDESSYLVLSWNMQGEYQLHQFPIYLPDPKNLVWDFPNVSRRGEEKEGRCIRGSDAAGTLLNGMGNREGS